MKISSMMQNWSYQHRRLEDWRILYSYIGRCIFGIYFSLHSIFPKPQTYTNGVTVACRHCNKDGSNKVMSSSLTMSITFPKKASTILLKEEPWRKLQLISRRSIVVDTNLIVDMNDSWFVWHAKPMEYLTQFVKEMLLLLFEVLLKLEERLQELFDKLTLCP